jgi:hypothetical protein
MVAMAAGSAVLQTADWRGAPVPVEQWVDQAQQAAEKS